MQSIRLVVLTAALLAIGRDAVSAQILDLTGVWAGTMTCKIAIDGVKETRRSTPVVAVTQTGNALGVRVDFGGGVVEQYTGLANPDGKKMLTKGEFGLIHCGTDSDPDDTTSADEIGRFTAATKPLPDVRATVKGTSVFSAPPSVGTCAWKWTRTALDDPGVATGCVE